MEKQQFENLKKLEARIFQLKKFETYLTSLLNKQPLTVTILTSFLLHEVTTPVVLLNGNELISNYIETEDGQAIMDAVKNQIIKLETEFKNI